ncbi:uncharacterized protein [Symphalangus syndactylus]|uniref:uncharacterized protein isoform X1 n=1 Tax=Symphalangus syndactylus TaxID=9590 RepID=UPI00244182A2|nr:uncharacterized protein LOC129471547 isoform X1 [Symphalangus syndactylus]
MPDSGVRLRPPPTTVEAAHSYRGPSVQQIGKCCGRRRWVLRAQASRGVEGLSPPTGGSWRGAANSGRPRLPSALDRVCRVSASSLKGPDGPRGPSQPAASSQTLKWEQSLQKGSAFGRPRPARPRGPLIQRPAAPGVRGPAGPLETPMRNELMLDARSLGATAQRKTGPESRDSDIAQAGVQWLFTGMISLLMSLGVVTCFFSNLGRFASPQATCWSPTSVRLPY